MVMNDTSVQSLSDHEEELPLPFAYRSLAEVADRQPHGRRTWQPTPVFLPGESQGQGSLVGCRLWGRAESGTTEATQQQQQPQPQAVDLPLASSAHDGFGEGHFPDSCAGGVHGQEPSLSALLIAMAPWCQQQ